MSNLRGEREREREREREMSEEGRVTERDREKMEKLTEVNIV